MDRNNNSSICKKLFYWSLVIAWMGMLFFFSAQTATESSALSGKTTRALLTIFHSPYLAMTTLQQNHLVAQMQHLIRNIAHVFSYFLLAILCLLATGQHRLTIVKRVFLSLFLGLGYALTDEIHQLFVEGRAFEVSDLGLDLCGILAGLTVMLLVIFFKKDKTKRQTLNLS